jgi:nucleoid-associated protein YgaU
MEDAMGTETRIGIVTGLIIVVVASVYFFYGSSSDKDEFLVATGSKIADPAKNGGSLKIPATNDKNKTAAPAVVGNAPGKPPAGNGRPTALPDKGPAIAGRPPTPGAIQPGPPIGAPRPAGTPGIAPSVAVNRPPTKPVVGPPAVGTEPRRTDTPTTPVVRAEPRASGEGAPGSTKTAVPAEKPAESVAAVPPKTTALRTGAAKELLDATRENLDKVMNRSTTSAPANGSSSDASRRSGPASADTAKTERGESRSGGSLTGETRLARSEPQKDATATKADRKEPGGSKAVSTATESGATPVAPSSATPGWPKQHKIAAGETIAALAQRYYGDSSRTSEILEANAQLKDPRRLKIGDTVVIPAPKEKASTAGKTESKPPVETGEKAQTAKPTVVAKATTPPKTPQGASSKTYQVRDGDTFYSIAKAVYGNGVRWTEIYELNKATLKNDPKHLKAGMVLKLPE